MSRFPGFYPFSTRYCSAMISQLCRILNNFATGSGTEKFRMQEMKSSEKA
jgi:hypothetical protein